jgi:hypothetical protein
VKLSKGLENLPNQHCLPCRKREYRTFKCNNSLKQSIVSWRSWTGQHVPPFIRTPSLKLLCKKSTTEPPSSQTKDLSNKTINKMPRTSSAPSSSLSSRCSFDSEHVPHQYINIKYCMNVLQRWEDIANAIQLTNNDHTAYTNILLLDHLFQSI